MINEKVMGSLGKALGSLNSLREVDLNLPQ